MRSKIEKWISEYTSIEIDFIQEPSLDDIDLKVEIPNNHLLWISPIDKDDFVEEFISLLKKYSI